MTKIQNTHDMKRRDILAGIESTLPELWLCPTLNEIDWKTACNGHSSRPNARSLSSLVKTYFAEIGIWLCLWDKNKIQFLPNDPINGSF